MHAVWEVEQKADLEVLYEDLERPPRLVRAKAGQAPQQAPVQNQQQALSAPPAHSQLLLHSAATAAGGGPSVPPGLG